jgi:spore coat protein U-like protein
VLIHEENPMKRILLTPLCAAALGMLASTGQAATATTTFQVTATVTTSCSVTANPLAFGNYSPGAASNATTTVAVTCSRTLPYTIGLDQGTGTGATTAARVMTLAGGGGTLAYGLFQNAARSTAWGNTAGTDTLAATGTGAVQNFPVYGQIAAGQSSAAGAYADTVTVSINY